jgi:4-hydroxy-tetrahydrodipicolinate reductase
VEVALYGAGQVAHNIATILARRSDIDVVGPAGRPRRVETLTAGADVVVIATTSFLADVAPDIRLAVEAGSNVITSAEEAAFPWAVNPAIADELDQLARAHGVTVLGGGLNPGFAFDALVLTALGPAAEVSSIRVERVVECSGFGTTVLKRIGFGYTASEFEAGTKSGAITGHIGFPQSMNVVAGALGLTIDRIDREITPIIGDRTYEVQHLTVEAGVTAGFEQHYVAVVKGRHWFEALFTAHLDPASIGKQPRDEIWIDGTPDLHFVVTPGLNPQSASSALIANSIRRVVDAKPGWTTVAALPPAFPL